MAKWLIPEDLQPACVRLRGAKRGYREIYSHLWPRNPPVSIGTFSDALDALMLRQEVILRDFARRENIPIPEAQQAEGVVTLELGPPVDEENLPAEVELAMADVRRTRKVVMEQIELLKEEPLPEATAGRDPAATRANAIGALSSNVVMLAKAEMDLARVRLDRTVTLYNLRKQRFEEDKKVRQDSEDEDQPAVGSAPLPRSLDKGRKPAFVLEMHREDKK